VAWRSSPSTNITDLLNPITVLVIASQALQAAREAGWAMVMVMLLVGPGGPAGMLAR
jgi:hypothetical protein